MSDPNLTSIRRTVTDALRESVNGYPRPTLSQLHRLPPKLRCHKAELIPIVDDLLRSMDTEDPRRRQIAVTLKRAQAKDGARPTGNFAHDVDNMRRLARLVRSLLDTVEDTRKEQP
ncbi:DUF6415 family natural product biosynthesis protein [Streptomyces sp. NPDC057555]|uniref:DUF6415 family natural product biosynthesis protein n=1 Tax=Streptomyces sp. NPDC057555 TaxID=3346166 RepID=UPI0036CBA320